LIALIILGEEYNTWPCYLCLFEKWNFIILWVDFPGNYNAGHS
jgi:hypothetical protein